MAWSVRAVPLPDGDRDVELWVDRTGCLVSEPVPDAERLPGRYVLPGLVDAHAHPAVGQSAGGGPVALDAGATLAVLAEWAASGVCLVRDVGSPGGVTLQLELAPGLPRVQAAGRFLAPEGQYVPALLVEGVPQHRLTEFALAELGRGGQWVKVIADFPPLSDGMPSGPAEPTYSVDSIADLVVAVHAAGGRVAVHSTTDSVSSLVEAGVDSIEHGTGLDESVLRLMATTGIAWTPTLCAVLGLPEDVDEHMRQWLAEYRQRLRELLPLAQSLGVPVLAGTDTAGTLAREVALLAEHGLEPAAALAAASTAAFAFLGEDARGAHEPITLVTYEHDPRNDLAVLAAPSAILIDGVRVR